MVKIGKPFPDMDLGDLCAIRTGPFLRRVLIYAAMCAGFGTLVALTGGVVQILPMVLLGFAYAHGVELQHQALHHTGFRSHTWNRIIGFFLGLPMLVSFSVYQNSHLHHHRALGTDEDKEFFNYGPERLRFLIPLFSYIFMVRHYLAVTREIILAIFGRLIPNTKKPVARRIRFEYRLMALSIGSLAAASVALDGTLILKYWLFPFLISIPIHSLIELPEHWGTRHDTLDLTKNTRTIKAGRFAIWLTNGNNFHIEHHWLPSVPNHRLPELHSRLLGNSNITPTLSYWTFYKDFLHEVYLNSIGRKDDFTATS